MSNVEDKVLKRLRVRLYLEELANERKTKPKKDKDMSELFMKRIISIAKEEEQKNDN